MASVTLKNVKKIYPFNGDDEKNAKKKKKKGEEPEKKKSNLQVGLLLGLALLLFLLCVVAVEGVDLLDVLQG